MRKKYINKHSMICSKLLEKTQVLSSIVMVMLFSNLYNTFRNSFSFNAIKILNDNNILPDFNIHTGK